jgi:polyhydroxyalkanoate synthesis regulator phasin
MNIFNMAKDLKGMEKMMKPALEKFMKDSGFVKKDVLDKLEKRVSELERSLKDLNNR